MRFISVLAAMFMLLSAPYARAGCANFTDGSMQMQAPLFEICYNGVCDITAMSYECGNVYSVQVGFDIGWSMDCDLNRPAGNQCTIYWQGRPIDQSKYENITCRPIDSEGTCNFP